MVWRLAGWVGISLGLVLAALLVFLWTLRPPGGDPLAALPQGSEAATRTAPTGTSSRAAAASASAKARRM